MHSGVQTSRAGNMIVIPAHAGIQAVPRNWIPAYAGMTFHRCFHGPSAAFNMHNTLLEGMLGPREVASQVAEPEES